MAVVLNLSYYMEEIKKDLMEDEDGNDDGDYMNRLREVSGSGLVNTRIADRENEVSILDLICLCMCD